MPIPPSAADPIAPAPFATAAGPHVPEPAAGAAGLFAGLLTTLLDTATAPAPVAVPRPGAPTPTIAPTSTGPFPPPEPTAAAVAVPEPALPVAQGDPKAADAPTPPVEALIPAPATPPPPPATDLPPVPPSKPVQATPEPHPTGKTPPVRRDGQHVREHAAPVQADWPAALPPPPNPPVPPVAIPVFGGTAISRNPPTDAEPAAPDNPTAAVRAVQSNAAPTGNVPAEPVSVAPAAAQPSDTVPVASRSAVPHAQTNPRPLPDPIEEMAKPDDIAPPPPVAAATPSPPPPSAPAASPAHAAAPPAAAAPVRHETAPIDPTPTAAPTAVPVPLVPVARPAVSPPASPAQPPTEQLAPVLVTIANTPTGAGHLTLQLQPDALGQLRIQIDRNPDSPMQVRIEAERPETLALLRRDTPQLQQALDRAGVPREAMTVSYHAAPIVTAAPAAQDAGQTASQFMGTGQSSQGFADRGGHRPPMFGAGRSDPAATSEPEPIRPAYARSGLDITA